MLTPAVNDSDAGDERFWAVDLVYASLAGKVMSNADIMKSFADKPKADPGKQPEAGPVFTAEDVLVRPYGDMAALTFRLVEHDPDGIADGVRFTFPRRNGEMKSGSFSQR